MNRSPNLVLLEGQDDVHFLLHLLYRHGFQRASTVPEERWAIDRSGTSQRIEIKPKEGYEKLSTQLRLELTPTHLDRVAVIVDANSDLRARFDSLGGFLRGAGFVNPFAELPADGLVIAEASKPVVGIWLMPDNVRPGYLEYFLADMIPANDTLWPRSQNCVREIPEPERRFAASHSLKAEVHTWLAWQESPGTRAAEAIVRQYLDIKCTSATSFVTWFTRWLDTSRI